MADEANNRVTMAVLATKLDHIAEQLDELRGLFNVHCAEGTKLEDRVTRLEVRTGGWQIFQSAYATVTAALAAWLGVRN